MLEVAPGFSLPEQELRWSFSRSGGPGGQNVNKVASRVTVRLLITENPAIPAQFRARLEQSLAARLTRGGELILHVETTREQARNREIARARLLEVLRAALHRPRRRRITRATRASIERRLRGKKGRAYIKRLRRPPGAEG